MINLLTKQTIIDILYKTLKRMFSSAGRASPLHGGGHRFDPCNIHHLLAQKLCGRIAKWPNAADCKSVPTGSMVRLHLLPPFLLGYRQAVRHQTLTLTCASSNLASPTKVGKNKLLHLLTKTARVYFFYRNNVVII